MKTSAPSSISAALRRRVVAAAIGMTMACAAAGVPAAARAQALPDFTELVERVGPAVVNIRTTERARAARAGGGELEEELLDFLRRRYGLPQPEQPAPRRGPQPEADPPREQHGVGSGFILNADGFVMTNAHVVDGAEELLVTLTDRREFKARVIGADKRTDVALLKIDATGLPTVRLGDVNRLKVGEWVIAIGSPFGLDNTVTKGIISAKARDTGDFLPLIQTDVPINPGNSGGPLINMRGEVVGINSQFYSRSGGFVGISFAIPIDEASRISEQLRTTGRVTRGRIGVQVGQVTKEVAEAIGLGKPSGALVRSVENGGPADKGGVEAGDVITLFDGRAIEKSGDLPRVVAGVKPGSKAALRVFRQGAYRDLNLTVGEFDAEPPPIRSGGAKPDAKPPSAAGPLGLAVSELTDVQRRELNVNNGVRVVSAEGAAAQAGVQQGDVILSMDNTEITDVRQFEALVAKVDKARPVNVLVRRGESSSYLVIRPGSGRGAG
jgi:serine protease Do